MRATVGPLPPAVYWRRRAVVLSAVVLGLIVLFVSCSGEDDPGKKKASSQTTSYPTPGVGKDPSASPSPSFEESGPAVGPALPDPNELLSRQPDDGEVLPPPANGATATAAPASGACADSEMSVTPVPEDTSPQRGVPLKIKLKIKNIGTRTCTRDLGASAQELYIEQGAQKYWSSDLCTTSKGNQVETLKAGGEREYEVTWNGRASTQCADNVAAGPIPGTGAYELRGRLDTLRSNPVILTIVA
ncbi:adhesin [Actinoplanes flavus]|uniref:Adhesin n=1 Tax=Actinoplanes flavus TaxID=2820290 RepID=A0ABS3URN8_9ACTN|nr:adhesin [Actinoplanes flavus]MBO3740507.1 adhesin [Actinoplanes flavus]